MKKIFLFSCLLLAAVLAGGCESQTEEDMRIELACPKPTEKVKDNVVTITWPEIAKTAGYAYKLDNGEYTRVEADVLTFTQKLANGTYIFSIYATGDNVRTTDSAVRTLEFVVAYDPSLPKPVASATTEGDVTTIRWAAVPKAVGYAYKVDGGSEVRVGADVLSFSGTFSGGKHTFVIRALGDGVDTEDSPEATIQFDVKDTSVGGYVKKSSGAIIDLTEGTPGVFTGTVAVSKSDSFTILLDNVEYGFESYSGNGGVGTVNSVYACVPFYNGYTYSVRQSRGRMSSKKNSDTDKVNAFWVNLGADANVAVKIDRSNADGVVRYDLHVVENDPAVVLSQSFDLFVWGGDWTYPGKVSTSGSSAPLDYDKVAEMDGTEAGLPKKASYTSFGVRVPTAETSPAYVVNRGLEGWGIENIYEFPGYIRLCNTVTGTPQQFGVLTTPALTALAGSAKITVEFEGLRFASDGDITVKVLNAGRITSASVLKDGQGSPITITPAGDTSFLITLAHGSKHANEVAKTFSKFTFEVDGATSATQICWDSKSVGDKSTAGRYCLDNILIKKK